MISTSLQKVPDDYHPLQVFLRKVLRNHYEDLKALYSGDAVVTNPIIQPKRVTSSPYTVLSTDDEIFVDTDAGAITLNLTAGVNGKRLRIINTGSSGNDVTITPNGTDLLNGVNASEPLYDSEKFILTYETTEGWW